MKEFQNNIIEEFQMIASDKGGRCLSNFYVNSTVKIRFECKNNHHWKALPYAIKRGQWCKKCSDSERSQKIRIKGLIDAKEYAKSKNGKCLSESYTGSADPLLWECEKGHKWKVGFGNIKNKGSWCPHCSNRAKLTIELMHELALKKEGKCLSNKYINVDSKLLWECKEGHQWKSIPYSIKKGRWCPTCAIEERASNQRLSIDYVNNVANSRGGKCLSELYTNSQTKLIWQCNYNHKWEATPNSILRGTWCPSCSEGLGERICREFFNQLFETKFLKSYPKWLVNKAGNQIELDGYSKKLKIAFEHQGGQHYIVDGFFIKSQEQLTQRIETDNIKIESCKRMGISLFIIPEVPKYLKIEEIKSYIKNLCEELEINFPPNFDKIEVNLKKAYIPTNKLIELKDIAKSRGGKCLSDEYFGSQSNMFWECKKGHNWKAVPNRIKQGSWCPVCAGNLRLNIDNMRSLAEKKGGKFLSNYYLNNSTTYQWKCSVGHIFNAKASNVGTGHWCPKCAIKSGSEKQKSSIKDMHDIAKGRNGFCISEVYISTHVKLKWKCSKGHVWEAIPSAVRRGSWCPFCSGTKKSTIEEMQHLAKSKNGYCLSRKYKSTHSNLKWKCQKGHVWRAAPSSIKSGSWCPDCSGNKKKSIEDMNLLARKRGGKCLSNEYINIDTKLKWECKYGHMWETRPYLITKGSWCPKCARGSI